jgi:hypothetical protein
VVGTDESEFVESAEPDAGAAADNGSANVGPVPGGEVCDFVVVGVLSPEAEAELLGVPLCCSPTGWPEIDPQAVAASTAPTATAVMADFLLRGLQIQPNLVFTMLANRNLTRPPRPPKRPSSGKLYQMAVRAPRRAKRAEIHHKPAGFTPLRYSARPPPAFG